MASDCKRVYERLDAARENGTLNLSECKLTQIPVGVFMVLKSSSSPSDHPILRCSLAKNALKKFPLKLCQEETLFRHVECLDVSANKISQLPPEIENLKVLKDVNLAENLFEYVPEILWSLPEVKRVDLAGNSISSLDVDRVGNVTTLEYLNLRGNPLNEPVKNALVVLAQERGFDLVCD